MQEFITKKQIPPYSPPDPSKPYMEKKYYEHYQFSVSGYKHFRIVVMWYNTIKEGDVWLCDVYGRNKKWRYSARFTEKSMKKVYASVQKMFKEELGKELPIYSREGKKLA